MVASLEVERRLLGEFLNVLKDLPGLQVSEETLLPMEAGPGRERSGRFDFLVRGQGISLVIETKKSVFPRDARSLIWQVKSYAKALKADTSHSVVPVLLAETISQGAKDLLKAEGIGFFDSGGSLYLPAEGAYIFIDKPQPKALETHVRSLYSGRRGQVLQALLLEPESWFKTRPLADHAKVSAATASQVLTELERFDWVEVQGKGPNKQRRLSQPGALLDAWVSRIGNGRPEPTRRFFVPGLKGEALVDQAAQAFEGAGVAYAVTHEAAAQRYAPFLSSISQVRFRLKSGLEAMAALGDLQARPVTEGANLLVIDSVDGGDLLFRSQVNGVWLANRVQVYFDLLRGEGRSKEMAAHLRKEWIGF